MGKGSLKQGPEASLMDMGSLKQGPCKVDSRGLCSQREAEIPLYRGTDVRLAHWLPGKIAERYERYDPQRPIDKNCHLLGATESLWEGQSCE